MTSLDTSNSLKLSSTKCLKNINIIKLPKAMMQEQGGWIYHWYHDKVIHLNQGRKFQHHWSRNIHIEHGTIHIYTIIQYTVMFWRACKKQWHLKISKQHVYSKFLFLIWIYCDNLRMICWWCFYRLQNTNC